MNQMPNRRLKVYLCYVSDDRPIVHELFKNLVRNGIDAWFDEEKLLPGQDWRREISYAIKSADTIIICLSRKTVTQDGPIQKEIRNILDLAQEKYDPSIFIIPCCLDKCDIPDQLSTWYPVNLFFRDGSFLGNGYEKLKLALDKRAEQLGIPKESNIVFSQNYYFQWEIFHQEKLGQPNESIRRKGLLGSVLMVGNDDIWTGAASHKGYHLTNLENPRAIKYFYAGVKSLQEQISIDVKFESSEGMKAYSGAGILFRFDPETKFYYAFILQKDNMATIYKRNNSGFQQLISQEAFFVKPNKWNTLAVHTARNQMGFYINGKLWSVVSEGHELQKGCTGIIALGPGGFYFEKYTLFNIDRIFTK